MEQNCYQLSKEINEFEGNSRWFYENMERLRKMNLVGKFVAVDNKEVVASGENFKEVVKELENQGKEPAYIFVEYVYPAGTVILL